MNLETIETIIVCFWAAIVGCGGIISVVWALRSQQERIDELIKENQQLKDKIGKEVLNK